jgi:hypothetical protein
MAHRSLHSAVALVGRLAIVFQSAAVGEFCLFAFPQPVSKACGLGMVRGPNVSGAKALDSDAARGADAFAVGFPPGRSCNGTLHLHQEAQGLPRMGWRLEPQLCWAVGPLLVRRASPIMSPQWCQRSIAFTLAIIMSHGDCRCTLWCFRLRIVARGSSGATTSAWRISSNGPGLGGLGEAPLPGFGVWSVAFQM